uniref:hypothetical protein n=1 Tax=Tessaracoccus bendigoensis TaxID=72764 RepID=UPI000934B2DA|nr:hypothetical protein [Tessaracoccus bendigoensis]
MGIVPSEAMKIEKLLRKEQSFVSVSGMGAIVPQWGCAVQLALRRRLVMGVEILGTRELFENRLGLSGELR